MSKLINTGQRFIEKLMAALIICRKLCKDRKMRGLIVFGEIAVVTTSGKAYYRLVDGLTRRAVSFVSLTPEDAIPISVKIVITTNEEKKKVRFSKVLVYYEDDDPTDVIEKALQMLSNKSTYDQVIVGVDPGKAFGIAVMGDGNILRSMNVFDAEEAAQRILQALNAINANRKKVKIGNGAKEYQLELVRQLNRCLPLDIILELVNEKGTTRTGEALSKYRHTTRDIMSAVRISMRKGSEISRGKSHE